MTNELITDERLGQLTKKAGLFVWRVFVVLPVIPTLVRLFGSDLAWYDKGSLTIGYALLVVSAWTAWD